MKRGGSDFLRDIYFCVSNLKLRGLLRKHDKASFLSSGVLSSFLKTRFDFKFDTQK
jgi:hypothetical protein